MITAAATRAAGWNRAGDIVAIHLTVGHCGGEFPYVAVSIGGGGAAFIARRQAAVDPIAAAVISNNEHALLGLRGTDQTNADKGAEYWDYPHEKNPLPWRRHSDSDTKSAGEILKVALTHQPLRGGS